MKEITLNKLNHMTHLTIMLNAAVGIALTALLWNNMIRSLDIGVVGRSIIFVLSVLNLLYLKRKRICYFFAAGAHVLFYALPCLVLLLNLFFMLHPFFALLFGVSILVLSVNILSVVYLTKYLEKEQDVKTINIEENKEQKVSQ